MDSEFIFQLPRQRANEVCRRLAMELVGLRSEPEEKNWLPPFMRRSRGLVPIYESPDVRNTVISTERPENYLLFGFDSCYRNGSD